MIYKPEGNYFTSAATGKHKMQHEESPTWCVHCGTFDGNCTDGYDCDRGQTGEFDTRTIAGFETVAKLITGRSESDLMPENLIA